MTRTNRQADAGSLQKSIGLTKVAATQEPRCADNGEGCGAVRTQCLARSTAAPFFWA